MNASKYTILMKSIGANVILYSFAKHFALFSSEYYIFLVFSLFIRKYFNFPVAMVISNSAHRYSK